MLFSAALKISPFGLQRQQSLQLIETPACKDGANGLNQFRRPTSVCCEGDTIFIADVERLATIVPLHGKVIFLRALGY